MHIVEQTKFLIGVVFAVIGIGILISSRRQRGFGQRKQAGVLLLIAAAVFLAIGLGYDPRAMLR
jgi:drug/metabolite transporter (DMT)-like permease